MNSVIEAQEEYFNQRPVLCLAPHIPISMLVILPKYSKDKALKDRQDYDRRCRHYVADQQTNLWDQKLNS